MLTLYVTTYLSMYPNLINVIVHLNDAMLYLACNVLTKATRYGTALANLAVYGVRVVITCLFNEYHVETRNDSP